MRVNLRIFCRKMIFRLYLCETNEDEYPLFDLKQFSLQYLINNHPHQTDELPTKFTSVSREILNLY